VAAAEFHSLRLSYKLLGIDFLCAVRVGTAVINSAAVSSGASISARIFIYSFDSFRLTITNCNSNWSTKRLLLQRRNSDRASAN
jgi:hypothetical protein